MPEVERSFEPQVEPLPFRGILSLTLIELQRLYVFLHQRYFFFEILFSSTRGVPAILEADPPGKHYDRSMRLAVRDSGTIEPDKSASCGPC